MSQMCYKMAIVLFSACFGDHLCYHSNCKSRINARLLYFGYCSNKLIQRYLRKATFIFLPHRGAGIASKCMYPFEVKFSLMMDLLLLWNWVYSMATAFVFLFQKSNPCVFRLSMVNRAKMQLSWITMSYLTYYSGKIVNRK